MRAFNGLIIGKETIRGSLFFRAESLFHKTQAVLLDSTYQFSLGLIASSGINCPEYYIVYNGKTQWEYLKYFLHGDV